MMNALATESKCAEDNIIKARNNVNHLEKNHYKVESEK